MLELVGLIFGGASRLFQHWLDLREKDAERSHELAMYDKQVELADKRFAHDAQLRQMDAQAAETSGDIDLLMTAIKAQADEASKAGGFVAKWSAAMRPLLTTWHCILIYTAVKAAQLMVALQSAGAFEALLKVYSPEDRALCFSMLSFWFVDRALRKKYGA